MRKYTKTIKKSSNRSAKSLNQKNKRNFVRYKILRKQLEYGINGGKAHRVQESILEKQEELCNDKADESKNNKNVQ